MERTRKGDCSPIPAIPEGAKSEDQDGACRKFCDEGLDGTWSEASGNELVKHGTDRKKKL